MSRIALPPTALMLLAFVIWPRPATAQTKPTLTAEQAMERYQEVFTPSGRRAAPCEPSQNPDEVVICGRRDVPRDVFPDEPGTRVSLLPGEPPSPSAGTSGCCGSGGGINVLKVVSTLRKGLGALLGKND